MTDEHEEQKNEEAMQRIEEQAARQRVPGAFDIAFLSGMEKVTEIMLIRHGQQEYNPNGTAALSHAQAHRHAGRTSRRHPRSIEPYG